MDNFKALFKPHKKNVKPASREIQGWGRVATVKSGVRSKKTSQRMSNLPSKN